MKPEIKADILRVIDESIIHLLKGDVSKLKELSNTVIHNASIFQDEDSVSIAVVIYALSKISERVGSSIDKKIIDLLKDLKYYIDKEDYEGYKKRIKKIVEEINHMDSKVKLYIEEVIKQAEIKKGTKIYDHGISVARASELLNISQWELLSMIGTTQISDHFDDYSDIKYRISFTRKLFGVKNK